jgi:hypothetical protein
VSGLETRTPFEDCLSAAWLSARLGIDTARIDALRRSGELIGVRPEGGSQWLYPAWQFQGGRPRPAIARVVAAAREAGIDEARLYDLMTMRMGLSGERRLCDLLVAGDDDAVISALRG